MGKLTGYLAMSLDGYIAGPHDEIAWVEEQRPSGVPFAVGAWAQQEPDALGFDEYMATIGCMVMGRRTYDVVTSYEGRWPYGDMPMLVPTHRPLPGTHPSVEAVSGDLDAILDRALDIADGKDVYVDGGATVRGAVELGRLDELTLSVMPTALGGGIGIFDSLAQPEEFTVESVTKWGPGLVQMRLVRGGPGTLGPVPAI